jgi:hypothetical protein
MLKMAKHTFSNRSLFKAASAAAKFEAFENVLNVSMDRFGENHVRLIIDQVDSACESADKIKGSRQSIYNGADLQPLIDQYELPQFS